MIGPVVVGVRIMNAIPIPGAGFPPLSGKSRVVNRWNEHLIRKILVQMQRDLWNVPRYLSRYMVLIMALYGLL